MSPLPKLPTLKPLSHIHTFTLLNFLNPLPDLSGLRVSETYHCFCTKNKGRIPKDPPFANKKG